MNQVPPELIGRRAWFRVRDNHNILRWRGGDDYEASAADACFSRFVRAGRLGAASFPFPLFCDGAVAVVRRLDEKLALVGVVEPKGVEDELGLVHQLLPAS
jgi:hypothetical protein